MRPMQHISIIMQMFFIVDLLFCKLPTEQVGIMIAYTRSFVKTFFDFL